jgi:hypothetical protein
MIRELRWRSSKESLPHVREFHYLSDQPSDVTLTHSILGFGKASVLAPRLHMHMNRLPCV